MEHFIHLYAIVGIVHRLILDLPKNGKEELHRAALDIIDRVIEGAFKHEPEWPDDRLHYVQEKISGIRGNLEEFKKGGFDPKSREFDEIVAMCVTLSAEDDVA